MMIRKLVALAALAVSAPAWGHIVFAEPEGQADSYYAGFLRVSHGCGHSATVSVRVEIPEALLTVRPQPKPGWKLAIEHAPLAKPVPGEGGALIRERVSAVTWTGELPADQFDQFGLMMKLPDEPGALYFPAMQSCVEGRNDWTTIPADPAQWHAVETPAPILTVTPARAAHAMH